MIRLLYWLFKKQFLKLAYDVQDKPRTFDTYQKVFMDSEGRFYYSKQDDMELPIIRGKEVQKRIQLIQASMGEANLIKFLDAMEVLLDEGKANWRAKIGHLIIEMRRRVGVWIDMELMFDTIALAYIREDEDPAVWNKVIHQEKIEQFKKDSQGVLYDFFYSADLIKFIPFLGKSTQEWNEYFEKSEWKMTAMSKYLASITDPSS